MTDPQTDLHWWSAGDLAAAIRAGAVSAIEALEHLVSRVESLDPPINAVVHWDLDRARVAARAADDAVVRGDDVGPLHGVPMTIKDSFQTEGCITTSGSPELADHQPTEDAWPVARLRSANARMLGAIVTKLDQRNSAYGYGYGYGYGYRYGENANG